MRKSVRRHIHRLAPHRLGRQHRPFFNHPNRFLLARARRTIRPSAPYNRRIIALRPVHRVVLVGRIQRQQPPGPVRCAIRKQSRSRRERRLPCPAPAARPLAAKSRIRQQPECRLHTPFPQPIRGVEQAPKAGIRSELQTRRPMRLNRARQPVHRSRRTQRNMERRSRTLRNQAFARAVRRPPGLIHYSAPRNFQRHQLHALQIQLARIRRRPRALRRRNQARLPDERKQRTEADGGRIGPHRSVQPLVKQPEHTHGVRNGGEQRVAVINRIDPFSVARVMSDAPRPGRPQPDFDQSHLHLRRNQ